MSCKSRNNMIKYAYDCIPIPEEIVEDAFKTQLLRVINEFKLQAMAAACAGKNHISMSYDKIKDIAPLINIHEFSEELTRRGYNTKDLEGFLEISW